MAEFSEKQLSDIALAAAKEAARQCLNETFALLGVNLSNFDDMKALREDLDFMRSLRATSRKTGARVAMTILTVASGGVAIAAWEFIKSLIHN